MRKTLLVIIFLHFLILGKSQSIIVNNAGDAETTYTAEQLLTNVLLDGGLCSSASNFQLKDNPIEQFPSANRSWGYFKKGNSNFPFDKGIILTTGRATDAHGPSDSGSTGYGDMFNWLGDSEANVLAGTTTYNATVFEFDFVPQGNEITFNYIFASEEYPVFACNSSYNDVFAFIISGPGITNDPGLNGKNIALLPNGLPVTINNVNNDWCGDATYYVPGDFPDIEYGGRTVPLTAYADVIPGQTYHIRLLIADAGDDGYDSAVFFEAGSFNLGSTIVDENGVILGEELMVCGAEQYTLHVNVDDPNVDLQWYKDNVLIPGATTNSLLINETGVYKIEVVSGDCSATDEIDVTFGELQTNGDVFTLTLEDTNGDGTENFNLTLVESQIVNNPASFTFRYYQTMADAEAETNYIENVANYPAQNGDIVYARVSNADGCYKIVTVYLRLVVNNNPCDFIPVCSNEAFDATAPVGNDGGTIQASCITLESEDVNWFMVQIESGTTFTFVISPEGSYDYDFAAWLNPDLSDCYNTLGVADRASYDAPGVGEYDTGLMLNETDLCETATGTGMVGGMVRHFDVQPGDIIIIAVDKFSDNAPGFQLSFGGDAVLDCTILGELSYAECDNDGDGQVTFDLASIATDIIDGDPTLSVKFYSNEADATNDTGNNIIPTAPYVVTTATSPAEVFAQVKGINGEIEEIITVNLSISVGVTGAADADVFFCDNGLDGTEVINLTTINLIANQANYTITYYETEQDANDGNATFIPNPSNYTTGSTTVYARIENAGGCFDVVAINIEVAGIAVDLGEGFSMCEGQFTLTAAGDFSGYTNVTFTWSLGNQILEGETGNTLVIDQPGTYTVLVNTAEGCTGTDSVVVSPGNAATITGVTVGLDYVIVEATGGATPYQYSTTGYVYQDSNQFNNLQPGIHTIYVRTAEGCVTTQQFAIFKIPTMFTPNGDGINDTWNIPGLEIYEGSSVVIYDRSGRLVYEAQLNSNVIWDGYFKNGQKAPTQDYWYIINVTDGRKFTGHVTVKSRGEKY